MKPADNLFYRNPNATFPTWKKVKFEMRIPQGEIKLSEGTTFDLTKSVMRWVGMKHSKTCLLLEESKKKGKVYLVGSDSEEETKALHDKIRSFILDFNLKENGTPIEDPKRKTANRLCTIHPEEPEQQLTFETKLPELFLPFEYMLNDPHLLTEDGYEPVFTSDHFRISQNKHNKQSFKFNITLDIPIELLVSTLQDYSAAENWNSMIEEISLYQRIKPKTYVILKEERRLASKLFNYSREYVFARVFYSAESKPPYFILEKSLEAAETENTRGDIKKAVYMLRPSKYNKGSSIIAGEIEISNNGLINSSTDSWLTTEYIKQFSNLEQFVSETQGAGEEIHELEKALHIDHIPQEGEELAESDYKMPVHQNHDSSLLETQANALIADVLANKHSQLAISKKFALDPGSKVEGVKKSVPLDISKGWDRNSNGVEFVDYELIKTQHRILGFLLKKMGKNLLMGKSILGVSLPVEIFDNKSVLGRIAEKFLNGPKYFGTLDKTSSDDDIFSAVTSFLLTTLVIGIEQHKPFNPILGETYQCWIEGCPLYMEQTFHHPPISSFIMYGKNFKFYGSIEFTASLHVNSASAKQLGVCTLEILDCKKEVKFIFPVWNVNGVTFGKRCMVIEGKSYIAIPSTHKLADLQFNPNKKGMLGGIFGGKTNKEDTDPKKNREDYLQINVHKLKPGAIDKIISIKDSSQYKEFDLKPVIIDKKYFGNGIWHEELKIENEIKWKSSPDIILSLIEDEIPLPSDSKYRRDLISFRTGNLEKSQKLKEEMEEAQRADRKFRAAMGPKAKK